MKNINKVVLINCLAWRGLLMMDNTFLIIKYCYHGLDLAAIGRPFFWHGEPGNFDWNDWAFISES